MVFCNSSQKSELVKKSISPFKSIKSKPIVKVADNTSVYSGVGLKSLSPKKRIKDTREQNDSPLSKSKALA